MTEYLVPFIRPSFPPSNEVARDLDAIVKSNWFTNYGPKEVEFSRALEEYLGQDLRVTTSANGTVALLIAVQCAFGRGDRSQYVLTPSFTFVAVPQAAIWNGYRPRFIDIDPLTWQASPNAARAVIESDRDNIAGVLLPNALGVGSPDIDEWERLAAEWDLPLVIDSAAGFGSRYEDGSYLGGRGTCEIFSFHATKPFTIGEGGALSSRDPDFVQQARKCQNFGFSESRLCDLLGVNGKLSELSASIGLRQLAGLENRIAERQRVATRYRDELDSLGFVFQPNAEASSCVCFTMCCLSPEQKTAVLLNLERCGVQARDYYNPPLHQHPYFAGGNAFTRAESLSVTEDVCSRVISLPIYDRMPLQDVELVLKAVREAA